MIAKVRIKAKTITAHQERHDALLAARAEEQRRDREASLLHVNAGGIGSIPAESEVDVSTVLVKAKNGSSIRITWDDFVGGFRIHADEPPGGHTSASCLEVLPMSSNVVVVRCKQTSRADAEEVQSP